VCCRFSLRCPLHLCRHPHVFIRRTARVWAAQNLVGYESQKSAREIRNRFKVAKGRKPPGFLQPLPETREPIHRKQSALSPESEEPITGNDRFFYSRSRSPETEEQSALSPQTRESRSALYRIGKKKPHTRKGWTRILADHSRARRVRAPFARSPKPEPGPARRGEASERARVFFLLPVTHTCKSMESIQPFKLGSLHLH
jgi:hypothetical protein